jgi:hypothetical protein
MIAAAAKVPSGRPRCGDAKERRWWHVNEITGDDAIWRAVRILVKNTQIAVIKPRVAIMKAPGAVPMARAFGWD